MTGDVRTAFAALAIFEDQSLLDGKYFNNTQEDNSKLCQDVECTCEQRYLLLTHTSLTCSNCWWIHCVQVRMNAVVSDQPSVLWVLEQKVEKAWAGVPSPINTWGLLFTGLERDPPIQQT